MLPLQLNNAVSGALDRLHYEKDPCVRYDGSRKVWIYLHRSRNEEDFGEYLVYGIVSEGSLFESMVGAFPQLVWFWLISNHPLRVCRPCGR